MNIADVQVDGPQMFKSENARLSGGMGGMDMKDMDMMGKDKALLEKLPTGKKVEFEFVQQGSDYTITSAK